MDIICNQCMFSWSVVWIVHRVKKASLVSVHHLSTTIYNCLMVYNYFPIVKLSKLVVALLTDITTYRGATIAKLLYVLLHFILILMYYWNCVDNDYLNSRLRTDWPTNRRCYLLLNNWRTLHYLYGCYHS